MRQIFKERLALGPCRLDFVLLDGQVTGFRTEKAEVLVGELDVFGVRNWLRSEEVLLRGFD